MPALVAFVGSRALPASWSGRVRRLVAAVLASGRGVAVSCCASGLPVLVRAACPSARVWSVSSFASVPGRARFAARSAALVRAVAASGPGAAVVGFVAGPCPAGVAPARSWRAGRPVSGSWSELALAAGLGLPVVVFWCASGPPALPSWPGWAWSPVAAGPCAGAWRLASAELPLFKEVETWTS